MTESQVSVPANFSNLPNEMLFRIFDLCGGNIVSLRTTCKRFESISKKYLRLNSRDNFPSVKFNKVFSNSKEFPDEFVVKEWKGPIMYDPFFTQSFGQHIKKLTILCRKNPVYSWTIIRHFPALEDLSVGVSIGDYYNTLTVDFKCSDRKCVKSVMQWFEVGMYGKVSEKDKNLDVCVNYRKQMKFSEGKEDDSFLHILRNCVQINKLTFINSVDDGLKTLQKVPDLMLDELIYDYYMMKDAESSKFFATQSDLTFLSLTGHSFHGLKCINGLEKLEHLILCCIGYQNLIQDFEGVYPNMKTLEVTVSAYKKSATVDLTCWKTIQEAFPNLAVLRLDGVDVESMALNAIRSNRRLTFNYFPAV